MHYKTLNEAWKKEVTNIFSNGATVHPRQLECKEIVGSQFIITNPRERLIYESERKMSPFYAIGELIWYLSGSNRLSFIEYYSKFWRKCSDDGKTLNSAYGYRIFTNNHKQIGFNQYENVVDILKKDKDSRQAIIHFKTPSNKVTKDEVCTLSIQFIVREEKVHAITTMRSNDVVWGTTYDIYFFTILQEMVALELGLDVGNYYHSAGSLHIYKKDYDKAEKLLAKKNTVEVKRNRHDRISKEFINNIGFLVNIEHCIRTESELTVDFDFDKLDSFSKTVVILLVLHKLYKNKDKVCYLKYRDNNSRHIMECYKNLLVPFDMEMACL